MDQKRQNKSVLVIDDKEVLGGAWYTKDLWGYSNLEVGCHTLKNKSKGYRVLKEQGVPMEVMQIQPAVTVAPAQRTFLTKFPAQQSFLLCASTQRKGYGFKKTLRFLRSDHKKATRHNAL